MRTPQHGKTMTLPEGTPTQVAHPWRSVIRVFVAWAVGLGVAALARWVGIDLTELAPAMVDSITVGVWAVATGFAQWLLAQAWMENFLRSTVPPLATGVHTEQPVLGDMPEDGPTHPDYPRPDAPHGGPGQPLTGD